MDDRPCRIPNCPGHYEREAITQALAPPEGVVVIDGLPADVCDFCGDTLLPPASAEAVDRLLRERPPAPGSVPLHHFADLADAPAAVAADTSAANAASAE